MELGKKRIGERTARERTINPLLFIRYYPSQTSVDKCFFRLASGTVGFSAWLKNSGRVITFLRRCGLQNTDHLMPFWPLKVDSLSHVFPAFVKCPLYNLRSFTETTSKDAKCCHSSNEKRKVSINYLSEICL